VKTFPDMDFNERVAWAKGHILVAVGEGRFGDAVFAVCHQFALWPLKPARKEGRDMAKPRKPQGPKVRGPQRPKSKKKSKKGSKR
jgi:hypothetical protein